jgi:hypothetical protein
MNELPESARPIILPHDGEKHIGIGPGIERKSEGNESYDAYDEEAVGAEQKFDPNSIAIQKVTEMAPSASDIRERANGYVDNRGAPHASDPKKDGQGRTSIPTPAQTTDHSDEGGGGANETKVGERSEKGVLAFSWPKTEQATTDTCTPQNTPNIQGGSDQEPSDSHRATQVETDTGSEQPSETAGSTASASTNQSDSAIGYTPLIVDDLSIRSYASPQGSPFITEGQREQLLIWGEGNRQPSNTSDVATKESDSHSDEAIDSAEVQTETPKVIELTDDDVTNAIKAMEAAAAADQREQPQDLEVLPRASFIGGEDVDDGNTDAAVYVQQPAIPEAPPLSESATAQIRAIVNTTRDHAAAQGYDVSERLPEVQVYSPDQWGTVVEAASTSGAVPINDSDGQTVGICFNTGDVAVVEQPSQADTARTIQLGIMDSLGAHVYSGNGADKEMTDATAQLVRNGYASLAPNGQIGEYALFNQCVAAEATQAAITTHWQDNPELRGIAAAAAADTTNTEQIGAFVIDTIAEVRASESGTSIQNAREDTMRLLEHGRLIGDTAVLEDLIVDTFGEAGIEVIAEWGRPGGYTNEGMHITLENLRDVQAQGRMTGPGPAPAASESKQAPREIPADAETEVHEVDEQTVRDAILNMKKAADLGKVREGTSVGDSSAGTGSNTASGNQHGNNTSSAPGEGGEIPTIRIDVNPEDMKYEADIEGAETGDNALGDNALGDHTNPSLPSEEAQKWLRDTATTLGVPHAENMSTEVIESLLVTTIQEAMGQGAGVGRNREQQVIVDAEGVRELAERQAKLPPHERWTGRVANALRTEMVNTVARTKAGVKSGDVGGGQENLHYRNTLNPNTAPIVLGQGVRNNQTPNPEQEAYNQAKTTQQKAEHKRTKNEQGYGEKQMYQRAWAMYGHEHQDEDGEIGDAARHHREVVLWGGQMSRTQWRLLKAQSVKWGSTDQREIARARRMQEQILHFNWRHRMSNLVHAYLNSRLGGAA